MEKPASGNLAKSNPRVSSGGTEEIERIETMLKKLATDCGKQDCLGRHSPEGRALCLCSLYERASEHEPDLRARIDSVLCGKYGLTADASMPEKYWALSLLAEELYERK